MQPNADPVIGAAGDIACDPTAPAFNNGQGIDTDCVASKTVGLLTGVDAVLPLGDNQYNCGGPSAFQQSYGPTWGRKLAITHPVPGDKDCLTSGGTDCPTTAGAGYTSTSSVLRQQAAAVTRRQGLLQLQPRAMARHRAQHRAVRARRHHLLRGGQRRGPVAAERPGPHTRTCTLAYYQNPRWASAASGSGGDTTYQQLWQDLYNGGADVVLNGDSHWYERFAPLNASGAVDNANGVREFIVGTGGAGLDTPGRRSRPARCSTTPRTASSR